MENPVKKDDLRVPPFKETFIFVVHDHNLREAPDF
jgi:hypothetical protein